MRRIYLFSDLECEQAYGQVVTQDYNPNANIITAVNHEQQVYVDARVQDITQLEENLVYTCKCVGEEVENQTTKGPEITSIADTTIAFPLGDVEEIHGEMAPTTHELYVEGGIKLEYQFYLNTDTDVLGVKISPPQYFAGYDAQEQPIFNALHIYSLNGTSIPWLGPAYWGDNSDNPIIVNDYSNYSNFQVIIVEAPTQFKRTVEPEFDTIQTALFPMLIAQNGETIECFNGYPNGYPAAISANALTSDEVIPEPDGDETNTGNNVDQDGQGAGLGVSDAAEHINITALNNGLSWGGTGNGLSYYKMPKSSFRQLLGDVWGTMFSQSPEEIASRFVAGIFNPDSSALMFNTDTIRSCLVGAFCLPISPTGSTSSNSTCWVGPYGAYAPNSYYITDRFVDSGTHTISTRFADDGAGDFSDFLQSTATLYLPFVGTINVDITALARGNLSIETVIDQYTGNITYWVYTTSMQAPNNVAVLYGVYTGNCAVDVPICGIGDAGNVMKKVMNIGSQISSGLGSVAMGDASGLVQAGIGLESSLLNLKEKSAVNRGGSMDVNSGALQGLHITLQIKRSRPLKQENRRDIEGIPSATKKKIKEFEGFLKVKSVDLKGLSCEDSEKAKIESMLLEGVWV